MQARCYGEGQSVTGDHFGDLVNDLDQAAAGELIASDESESTAVKDSPESPTTEVPVESDTPPRMTNPVLEVREDPAPPTKRALGATVRVAEEKLDGLMAQAGELLVARQQIEVRPNEVESVAELTAECRAEFQSIQRLLLTMVAEE